MKRLLLCMLSVLLMLGLIGCEKKPNVDPTAEITGTVVVRTSHKQADQDMFEEMFEKKYPNCDLVFQYGSIGETMAAVKAAKDNPDTDVVLGGLQQTDGDKYHDLFQPYTSVNEADQLAHDPTHYYTYYTTQVMCFIVNTDVLPAGVTIKGYADLLNPALKGLIMHADPSAASSAWRELETMLAVYGGKDYFSDAGWDYVSKLMDNLDGKTTTKSSDVVKNVVSGEYAVGLSYESTCVENWLAALDAGKTNIQIVYPEDGNTEVAFASAIVANCPNPEAAKAVIDMVCSKEYLDARLDLLGASRGTHKDCKTSDAMPATSTLHLIELDLDALAEQKTKILEKYAEMWVAKYPN